MQCGPLLGHPGATYPLHLSRTRRATPPPPSATQSSALWCHSNKACSAVYAFIVPCVHNAVHRVTFHAKAKPILLDKTEWRGCIVLLYSRHRHDSEPLSCQAPGTWVPHAHYFMSSTEHQSGTFLTGPMHPGHLLRINRVLFPCCCGRLKGTHMGLLPHHANMRAPWVHPPASHPRLRHSNMMVGVLQKQLKK